jgi:hypothetical protein
VDDVFVGNVNAMREAAQDDVVKGDAFGFIQRLGKAMRLTEAQRGVVFAKLLEEKLPTRLAVTQAMTAASQTDAFTFAEGHELERMAGLYLYRQLSLN